jgi:hypothetical protein
LQIELIQSISLGDLSPRGLLRYGKNLLSLLKKANGFLRQDEQDDHWGKIKSLSLAQLIDIPIQIKLFLISLDPEESEGLIIGFVELLNSCSIFLHEESQMDGQIVEAIELTDSQIKALRGLYSP